MKKRDEASLKILNGSNLRESDEGHFSSKEKVLENRNEELLNQVEKLEGIRGALEEKVSAYRYRLKELTKQLEERCLSSTQDEVVYHNKDSLERRRFIIRRNTNQQSTIKCSDASMKESEAKQLQEKYEQLLKQYMYERERNEALFDYLFQKEENAGLELFVKTEAADTLLEATRLSRKIIQQAEYQARNIESNINE